MNYLLRMWTLVANFRFGIFLILQSLGLWLKDFFRSVDVVPVPAKLPPGRKFPFTDVAKIRRIFLFTSNWSLIVFQCLIRDWVVERWSSGLWLLIWKSYLNLTIGRLEDFARSVRLDELKELRRDLAQYLVPLFHVLYEVRPPVVNFINILWAVFVPIFLRKKNFKAKL